MGSFTDGSSSKGGTSGIGGGGLSPDDLSFIEQALGMGTNLMHNTYKQLGIGVPDPNVFGGNPAVAAASGGNLQYGSPGTAEQTDIGGLNNMAQAALGQLQVNNQSNPAISGTPANTLQNNQQLSQLLGQFNFNSGAAAAGGGSNLGTGGATL